MVGRIVDLSEWVNLNTPYTWTVFFFYQISKLDFFCFCFLGISIFIYGLIIFIFKKCYYFASNMTNQIKFVIMLKM